MESFRPDPGEVRRAVTACGLFGTVDDVVLDELCTAFVGLRLMTGELLVQEGDAADALFVVRHGRLRATVTRDDGTAAIVGEIGKLEVVGEMGVITDQPRTTTVTATRDTDVFRLPAERFLEVVGRHPQILRPIASVVIGRLRSTMTRPHRPSVPATIALVDIGGADVARLAHEIAAHTVGLTVRVIERHEAPPDGERTAWLLDLESHTDLALLVADGEPTDWTRRCLRHADRVMLVGQTAAGPALSSVESDPACADRLAELSTHLVIEHEGHVAVSPWLLRRSPATTINIRRGSSPDLARLCRAITGRSNIAVLSGGGARGFAHFGVIRALAEHDIPIDGIVGTSAGSIVGGLIARVGDTDWAQREMIEWFERTSWRRDMNPPVVALTTGRTITDGLRELGGGSDIENLPIGFAAVACDLVTAGPVVIDRGPLWRALRASGSVPGMFPPIRRGDQLLVDGGLVANIPVDLARARTPNARIIAVDVGDPAGIGAEGIDGSGVVNGWSRLRRSGSGVTLLRLMMRLTELGRQDTTDAADVVVTPDVRRFGLTDVGQAEAIADLGYRAGLEAIDAVRAVLDT